MQKIILRLVLFFLVSIFSLQFLTTATSSNSVDNPSPIESSSTEAVAKQDFSGLPLLFITNQGQIDNRVLYYAKANGQTVYLTEEGIVFDLIRYKDCEITNPAERYTGMGKRQAERFSFSLDFRGANCNSMIEGVNVAPGKVNYLIGNDPEKWHTDIPLYTEVVYRNIYPNIDFKLYDDNGTIRYDFIVNPGGDAADISLAYNGLDGISLDDNELIARTAFGEIRQSRPVIYQESSSEKIAVSGGFMLNGNSYGFHIAGYNPELPLIIDPAISYSTYFGGTGNNDLVFSVALDGTYAYITGQTNSSASFPIKAGSWDTSYNGGNYDAFIAKINTAASGAASLVYSTYLGGSGSDWGNDIGILSNEAYIIGTTDSTDFPWANTTFYRTNSGEDDIFVTRLNSTGNGLITSLYVGGNNDDYGNGIYVSSASYVLIAGDTYSANMPVGLFYQNTNQGAWDAYFAKIDMTNGTIGWGSYFGGTGWDWGTGVALSADNNPVLTGRTQGTSFPARTAGAYQTTFGGGAVDTFVVRFNGFPSGGILYHTYLGGSGSDDVYSIACSSTTVYVAGTTYSNNYPTTANAYQSTDHSENRQSGFVSVLNMAGGGSSDMKYSTYFGNDNYIELWSMTTFPGINYQQVWITGETENPVYGTSLPVKNAFQSTPGGSDDAFVAGFDPNLSGNSSLLMSSYLGGNGLDRGGGIAASSDRVCVVGYTESTDFNTTNGYQTTKSTGRDGFITAITGVYPEIAVSPTSKNYGSIPVGTTSTQTFTVSNTGTGPLSIGTVTLEGTNANQFSILNDNCSGQNIAPSSSRTFQGRFNPTATGSKTARVRIINSDVDEGQLLVELSGTATAAPGITVNPSSGLVTTEAGGTATFTIVLQSQPTANVTIGLSSSDTTEGTVSPASVTFTSANWSTAQTVTVTGVDDFVDDGNISYTIVTAVATSTDPNYSGRDATDVSATNNDNDTAGFTVNPTTGLVTTEAGGTATFTVKLNSQPTATVTVGFNSSDSTEGSVSPSSVTFTTANWNTNQTVTVTGVNDFLDDGNIAYAITTNTASSIDTKYNGLNPPDVSVINNDNDTAGFTITPTSGLTTTETGGTATFTVKLTSQPTANVTIGLTSSDTTEGTVSPASLTFTSSNWNTNQTVTVTGVNDFLDDGNIAYTIVTASATSSDSNYNGLNPSDVSVTNTDNDSAGITVNPTIGLVTNENGGTATFTVVLNSEPTGDVIIGLSSNDTGEGTVSPASLTFTTANWNTARTVTITGVNDDLADGPQGYQITTAAATSSDSNYNNLNPSDVMVTNNDNDTAGITVTPTSGLTTTESGGTATFTVVLNTLPSADVTIGISSSNTAEGTVLPASLTFITTNWSTPQTVTITGANDSPPVMDGNIPYTINIAAASSSDPNYNGKFASTVSVTNTDDDSAGFTVTPTSGLVTTEASGTATFTVVLTTRPTADVTIGLSSNDITEGTVSPASLTFTSANWNTAQLVTVTGINDAIADGNVAYTVITAAATSSDPNYNGLDPSDVSVTNTDNDSAGFTITPTSGLVTTEAGGTAAFTVVLNTQPNDTVTIGLGSNDTTEGTVSPHILTFTTSNWNTPQTVTVTGVDDLVADGNQSYMIVTDVAISSDASYNGLDPADVNVTNNDNEIPGITINPTNGLVTSENGGTATFTAVLNTQPTYDVTFTLSSSDATEGAAVPASLTFTATDWYIAQTVTVTGVDDTIADGTITYIIVTSAATSADSSYNSINPSDVSISNNDNDINTATATGIASIAPDAGTITGLSATTQSACGPKPGFSFPHGFFSFTITGITPSSTVTITITLPSNVPVNTQYWKCINGTWIDVTSILGSNDGDNILTLTITDGGLGDADGTGNGIITDPGGPAIPVTTQQTLSAPPQTTPPKPKPFAESSSAPTMPDQITKSAARLSVKYLNVQPQQAKINQPITIAANIANSGDESGKYIATLKINGQIEQTRTGTVGAHVAQPISFTVSKDKPGTYTVDINGQQSSFTITGQPASRNTMSTAGILYMVLAIMIIAVFILAILVVQRRKDSC